MCVFAEETSYLVLSIAIRTLSLIALPIPVSRNLPDRGMDERPPQGPALERDGDGELHLPGDPARDGRHRLLLQVRAPRHLHDRGRRAPGQGRPLRRVHHRPHDFL